MITLGYNAARRTRVVAGNRSVGVAPSTSTLYIPYHDMPNMRGAGRNGLGLIDERGPYWWTGRDVAYRPATPPGGKFGPLSGAQLGLIDETGPYWWTGRDTPYYPADRRNTQPRTPVRQLSQIPFSGPDLGSLRPSDITWRPQTTIPSDFDLAKLYQYLPVEAGWLPPGMQPPSSPPGGDGTGLSGFGNAAILAQAVQNGGNGIRQDVDSIVDLQRSQLRLQKVATIAMCVVAGAAVITLIAKG